jgi:hypothetical protein
MKIAALGALLKGDIDNFIVASTSGGIEEQEAFGQRSFVANNTLPIEINHGTRAQFEAMGIVFGEPADDLFINVQLPAGWKKERTDHSMWSNLLDEKGRKRASIFYKAAFYDQRAHMNIERRFNSSRQPLMGWDAYEYESGALFVGVVTDCGNPIWQSEPLAESDGLKGYDRDIQRANAWLNKHYPDWKNPLAYWED